MGNQVPYAALFFAYSVAIGCAVLLVVGLIARLLGR